MPKKIVIAKMQMSGPIKPEHIFQTKLLSFIIYILPMKSTNLSLYAQNFVYSIHIMFDYLNNKSVHTKKLQRVFIILLLPALLGTYIVYMRNGNGKMYAYTT